MYDTKACLPTWLYSKAAACLLIYGVVIIAVMLALIPDHRVAQAQSEAPATAVPLSDGEIPTADHGQVDGDVRWTSWGANQHALADDGNAIWIGGAGSLIRFDKAEERYTRHFPPQMGAFQHIYAVAVDTAGNRWFGGDRGLSRLDVHDQWQHFSPENSDMHEEMVVSIAVGAEGTIWMGHDLEPGSISRLAPDGSWSWFPSRSAAVVSDYDEILNTLNANRLWTVAGADIWVDLSVYTGTKWIEQAPVYSRAASIEDESASSDRRFAADSRGNVYVTSNSETVSLWNGQEWSHVNFYDCMPFGGMINRVAVDQTDRAWFTWHSRAGPYSNRRPGIDAFDGECLSQEPLPWSGPVVDMLATHEGLWILGPTWLRSPQGNDAVFLDMPFNVQITDHFHDAFGQLWVYSNEADPYSVGGLQQLDDQGTIDLNDDSWTPKLYVPVLRARTAAANGDVWVAASDGWRADAPMPIMRYNRGEWIRYMLGGSSFQPYTYITDIFAAGDGRVWFAHGLPGESSAVTSLDDGGTPDDPDDDIWTTYPQEFADDAVVATDNVGRIWVSDDEGLHRFEEDEWQTMIEESRSCGLIPVDGGAMIYLKDVGAQCHPSDVSAIVFWSDDRDQQMSINELITEHRWLVDGATRSTPFWSVAEDGDIWYLHWYWSHEAGEHPTVIRRRDNTKTTDYPLPFGLVDAISVGPAEQVWAHDGRHLLRLTQAPDFSLRASPSTILVAPDNGAATRLQISSIGDFHGPVTFASTDLPAGMVLTYSQNPAMPDAVIVLEVSVDATVSHGAYEIVLTGTSEIGSHTTALKITVAAERHEYYLPQLRSGD